MMAPNSDHNFKRLVMSQPTRRTKEKPTDGNTTAKSSLINRPFHKTAHGSPFILPASRSQDLDHIMGFS